MKNLKKLLASALLVCMLVSLLPMSALAEGCAHNYVMTVTANPGCTSVGSASYTCSVCENTYNAEIPATGHSYQVTATTAPSCAAAGSTTYTCSHCGDSYVSHIDATGVHTPGEPVTKAATCTAEGSTTVSCTVCGAAISSTVIPATGIHTPGEAYVTTEATCTTGGSTAVECTVCGGVLSTDVIPALGHSSGEPVTEPASCTADGSITVKCTVCGEAVRTEIIPATGHTAGEETVITKATCIAEGSKSVDCTVCGETYTVVIPATGHTPGEETVITEATCIAEGSKSVKCTVCGETYTAIIPATGVHSEGAHTVTKEATCEEAGEETISCATEGCEYSETVEIPALGHKYNEQHECSVCGEKEPPLNGVLKNSSELTITGENTVHVGKTITLAAVDGDNNPVSVTWSSGNTDVATVGANGLVTGESAGTAIITATADDSTSDTIEVTVSDHDYGEAWKNDNFFHWKECSCGEQNFNGHTTKFDSASNIFVCTICGYEVDKMGAPAISSEVADGQQIPVGKEFTMYLSRNIIGLSVTWQSGNESVVKYEGDAGFGIMHKFKALAAGTATITASYEGGSVSRTVTVVEAATPATKITLTAPETVYVGDSFDVTYTLEPADSTDTVTWEISDTTKVVPGLPIDGKVPFHASAAGTVTITAKANDNVTASAQITVSPKKLTITGGSVVKIDDTLNLTATVTPDDTSNPTPIYWTSSHPDIATVDANGVVTGVAKGKATITATANDGSGVSASIDVYVQEGTTPYIYVEKSEINIGETVKVRLVYAGDNAPATVTWSVNPTTIATIKQDASDPLAATVTGVAVGKVTITATSNADPGKSATHEIEVKAILVTEIQISGDSAVLVGSTIDLDAAITPDDATDKTVTWESSDPTIATVDEDGKVTGLKADKVTITATSKADPTKSASKEITVKAPDLTVSGPGTVAVGKTITLTAKVGPDEVKDKTVTWKSSDETIATVDKDGKVTGKKVGDVKITATSNAYTNLAVEFPVKVTAAVYLYYGNGSHFNGIHPLPFVSSDVWAGGAGVSVIINGVPLVPGRDFSCYSSPHGMIGVTVNPGLLRLLPQNAWHSIEIVSANGVAAGSFSTGYFGYYNIYGVKTGDDSTPMLWAALCLLGISGAGIILAKSRKRKA